MKLYHDSHSLKFREPFGAVCTESEVVLTLSVTSKSEPESVTLRLWEGDAEKRLPMRLEEEFGEERLYRVRVKMPEKPCLVWYYFIAEADGETAYYSNNQKRRGGEGVMTEYATDISYQITVFDKDFKTPNWFKNTVMYQIFPDRFCRGGEFSEIPGRKSEYTVHEDWYEPLENSKHPFEDGPACNDFYGGNLLGIMSKISYLRHLGVKTVYLNPIFEAFSNHRYDTGDYSKIDPALGTEADFVDLCNRFSLADMNLILDGVFSHTGSDSVYFNKYGTYGEKNGAFRDGASPYRDWYRWTDGDGGYESWWGCSNLPNVNETEPTYVDYVLTGDDAIIKKWLRLGASGWRLDVADELPDGFISLLRREVKKTKSDAVVIGEVWEDASNKISYGEPRKYLLGGELDSVMNYPFKDGVLSFIMGDIDAEELSSRMTSLAENYPKEALYSVMNIIGTHDTSRAKTVLGGKMPREGASFEEKMSFRLSGHEETLAVERLKLAAFIQMTYVGVPCVYYGDEIGMQGTGDPFNRMPFDYRHVDTELLDYYRAVIMARNTVPCLGCGEMITLIAKGGLYVYLRRISGGKDVFGNGAKDSVALCAVNRSDDEKVFEVPSKEIGEMKLRGFLTSAWIFENGGKYEITLAPRTAEVFLKTDM